MAYAVGLTLAIFIFGVLCIYWLGFVVYTTVCAIHGGRQEIAEWYLHISGGWRADGFNWWVFWRSQLIILLITIGSYFVMRGLNRRSSALVELRD